MKYYLFLDESGDHGLKNVDESFPIFVLCGILISQSDYEALRIEMNQTKMEFWNTERVIFHSRDIRKCEKEFQILFEKEIKKKFYDSLNKIMSNPTYTIIASVIDKIKFLKKYGKLNDDVYEISLSFMLERSIFCLNDKEGVSELEVIIEKRGKKEDKKLHNHLQRLLQIGTYHLSPARFEKYKVSSNFYSKHKNINGLQLADLAAYPIARYILDPESINLAFQTIENNIYSKNGKKYGIKKFP